MNDMIEKFELPLVMGRRSDGADWVANLASFPHILIGGMAGSGKSSFLRSALVGFIQNRSPEELKLIIYDGKACVWMDIKPTFPYLLALVMMGRPWLHDREFLCKRAVEICRGRGKATTAILQRELEIGYRMAEELVNRLKADGLVRE